MATALRINASSGPPGTPQERKRKPTSSHAGNNDKRNPSVMSDKYIHVHHYLDTGRWGTWFNDPTLKRGSGKRRLYFGTYETEYLAARAQDRAALKFKPDAVKPITRLNFAESDYVLDKDLRERLTHGQFRRLLMAESRKCYKRAEPSPCWKIFLEEEAAKGSIHIEYGSTSNRYRRKPRTFPEVLQEIVSKNEAVDREQATEPIDDPVVITGDEEGKVYTAKRIKCPTQAAHNQPAEEVTTEVVAEDPANLPTRSVSARQVLNSTKELVTEDPAALPAKSPSFRQVRNASEELVAEDPAALPSKSRNARQVHNATKELVAEDPAAMPSKSLSSRQVRNATKELVVEDPAALPARSLNARPVRYATPEAASPVRHDTRSASASVRQNRKLKATSKAMSSLRRDTRNASLSAPQVRKSNPKAAPPVLRRDTRNPSQSARPVPKGVPEAAQPVRRASSIFKGGVWRAEGEGRSTLQPAQQSSSYLDRLQWGRTRGRSTRNFSKVSLPNAASTEEATVAADSMNIMMMAANIFTAVSNGNSGTSDGKVAHGSDHMHAIVENPSKRIRPNIDLNREPEPSTSSTASTAAPPHESDITGGNDDPEVTSVETLLLLKSGWLQ